MLNRNKLFNLLTDQNNPAHMWFPNNAEMWKLANYIAQSYSETDLDDGTYMELFAVQNNIRYDAKIVDMRTVSVTLTNGLMDGIEKLWMG